MTFPRAFTQSADPSRSYETWPLLGAPDALTQLAEDEFYALAKQTPWRMLAIGARLRSIDTADVLAREATAGSHDWAAIAKPVDASADFELPLAWDLTRITVASLIAAVLEPGPASFERVIRLLRTQHDRIHLGVRWAEPALRLATQIAVHQGARDVFDWACGHKNSEVGVVWAGSVDFMGPATPTWAADFTQAAATGTTTPALDAWWRACNEVVVAAGVEPFELDVTRFGTLDVDNLFAAFRAPTVPRVSVQDVLPAGERAADSSAADVTVSVIVPAYNPTVSFLATIQSLLDQSWPHTEIVVVDDCSPEGLEYFEQAQALDSRVRVIRLAENGGAYRARNRGLAEARGSFVTFQDADDLSHSRRIERQLRPLLSSPKLMGTTSRAQRVRADGALTFFGYLSHRINDSSLLFRKDEVLARLGGFDEVRKGSDSEFHERVQAAFGAESVLALEDVLSLVQLTTGSLSRSDFRYGWMSGSRASYFHQFRAAHKRIAATPEPDWRLGRERPHISWSDPALRGAKKSGEYATAVLGDWKARVERASGLAAIVQAASVAGAPVALLTGVRPRFSTVQRDGVAPEVAELVEGAGAVWANWADTAHIDTLVVPDPEYLMFLPDAASAGVTVERVVVLLDQPVPHTPRGISLPPLDWAERRVTQRFGVRTEWASNAPGIEALLRAEGRAQVPHPFDVPFDVGHGQQAPEQRGHEQRGHERADGKRPTVGVALPAPADKSVLEPDAALAFFTRVRPEHADLVVYDEVGLFDALTTRDLQPWHDASVTLLRGDQHSRREFMARLDALLVDPFDAQLLSSASWIALAHETNIPVFAPRSYAAAYGDRVHTYTRDGAKDLVNLHLLNARIIGDSRVHGRSPLAGLDPYF
ncbi:glycosyltransferase family 2 protein [Leucobacter sp. HY1910]